MNLKCLLSAALIAASMTTPASVTVDRVEPCANGDIAVFEVSASDSILMVDVPLYKRVASGVVSDAYMNANGFVTTTIRTQDGNEWALLDYVAPIGTPVSLTFDVQNASDLYDDIILSVVPVAQTK